jgi:peptide-methionine (S)-S-oxide reductase
MRILLFIITPLLFACNAFSGKKSETTQTMPAPAAQESNASYAGLDTAYFASGCFWCVEAIFESLRGVAGAESGYAGGHVTNPTYEQVCSHTTGHTEAVRVYYDAKVISYDKLLEVYFGSMDPTQVNAQGPDKGDSYRSVIFYRNNAERDAATNFKTQLGQSGKYNKPIAVIIEPHKIFYMAEGYHQNYEKNNPNNPYVRGVSVPRLNRMKAQFPELLKSAGH